MKELQSIAGLVLAFTAGILFALSTSHRIQDWIRRGPIFIATRTPLGIGVLALILFGMSQVARYRREAADWAPTRIAVASRNLRPGEPLSPEMVVQVDAPRFAAGWLGDGQSAIEGLKPTVPIAKGTPILSAFLVPRDPKFCEWLKAPRVEQPEPDATLKETPPEITRERRGPRLDH